ncbi:AT-rich interactive domain-containing protein 4B-like [Haliotis cracherodii]|uniref:AT-rich interactive domain-containing protein 4B-like n=1 Tax=Haliotis cracherodii TaxID=6455 RepID=UPI0039ECB6C4
MAGNEPPYLPVGTDVSAKYRGAFCEAKVKKIVRTVKCKVILKETQTSVLVTDDNVKGTLKVGVSVEIKHPETSQVMEGVISKLTDQSMYTVVFDDGDEKTLRRTQLCLKGEKHFIESETLDNLPLSHPEHFGTPVLQTKSRKRTVKMGSPGFNTLYLAQEDTESDESSSEDNSPKRASYRGRQQELVGKVMVIEAGDKRKGGPNPVLVVLPDAASMDLKTKDHVLVKSFKDGKFLSVLKKELKDFTREIAIKNEDKNLKTALEKALLYFDNHELPGPWKREELLGSDEEEDMGDEDSSDDEPSEEKDRFVAQLYKFMDDRGTPINKGPSIGTRDLNLYKLFRVVQNLGGYNRVTNQMKWRLVYSKMALPQSNTASHQIKNAYKKFLHAFEDFYRKLGSTMGTISRPGRSRHSSGRSILAFRGREKDSKSPKPVKPKESDKEDSDKGKSKSDESQSEDGKEVEEDAGTKDEVSTRKEESDSEPVRKERTTPRRMLRDDLKEAKEKEKEKKEEARRKKEEKEEQAKSKKEEREEAKSKKEEKEEAKSKKEEKDDHKGKKDDKKASEDDRKSSRRDKQEDKSDSKKDEVKSDRETRGQRDRQKEDVKVEKEKPKRKEKEKEEEKDKEEETKAEEEEKSVKKQRVTRRKSGRGDEGKKEPEEKTEEVLEEKKVEEKKVEEMEVEEKKVEEKKIVEKKAEEKKVEEKKTEEKKMKKEDGGGKVKKEDKKESKKEDKKEQKKEEKKEDKKKEPKESPKPKEDMKSKLQEEEESDDDAEEEQEEISLRPREEFPTGTKLKVRYGRGRNQKVYEAKVVEANKDGSHKTYLVHYAGWNNRYDEWVKADRIISIVNRPDSGKHSQKKIVSPKAPSPKLQQQQHQQTQQQQVSNLLKKRGRPPSSGTPSPGGSTSAEFRTPTPKSKSPAPGSGQSSKTRPTRSNSMEGQVMEGLPPKRLTRRSSGITETSDTVSHASDESSDSDSDETEQKIVVVVEEHKLEKDSDEFDVKESEHDTSMEEEPHQEEHDTSVEEKDTDVSRDGELDLVTAEDDSLLQCTEEMLKSEEEDMDHGEQQISPSMEPEPEKVVEEEVEKVSEVIEVKEDPVVIEEPRKIEPIEKKEEIEKALEKDSAPELVAEKPFKELVTKCVDGKTDTAADEARYEASEALLQMPVLHEAFKKMPEEPKEIVSEVKKQEPLPMPEIKKIEPEVPKKEKEVEKKERGRKQKKDTKEGKKQKVVEPVAVEPKPAEPHVMTPQEARMKAAMDLYDFQGFEEPEELVLRRDKKSDLLGRRFLTIDKEVKPDVVEGGETEKKKVKKKVKKKTVLEEDVKKESDSKDVVSECKKESEKKECKKESEKKETEVKKDSVKESAKVKGVKGERCAKKDSKKIKDVKVSDIEPAESGVKEKKEKRPRSRSPSPVNTCSKVLKFEPVCPSPKPSTSAETVSTVKDLPREAEPITELSVNTMLDNTPPTTPEHELNEAEPAAPIRTNEARPEMKDSVSVERTAKLRSESPSAGECSASSLEVNENNSALPCSESSNDVEVASVAIGKRKRETVDTTPSKKKKRISKGGKASEKKIKTVQSSDSDETNTVKLPSPVHVPGPSSPMKMPESAQTRSPRPPKYNFNIEEGKYLEGDKRIEFLIDKMQEIRKIYMNLKQEVACIDRRRKRAKRKERENSQSSQMDCDSS